MHSSIKTILPPLLPLQHLQRIVAHSEILQECKFKVSLKIFLALTLIKFTQLLVTTMLRVKIATPTRCNTTLASYRVQIFSQVKGVAPKDLSFYKTNEQPSKKGFIRIYFKTRSCVQSINPPDLLAIWNISSTQRQPKKKDQTVAKNIDQAYAIQHRHAESYEQIQTHCDIQF